MDHTDIILICGFLVVIYQLQNIYKTLNSQLILLGHIEDHTSSYKYLSSAKVLNLSTRANQLKILLEIEK